MTEVAAARRCQPSLASQFPAGAGQPGAALRPPGVQAVF
jgi:hypothetical protein